MADIILKLAGALIFLSITCGVARLVIGRTVVDRIVAIDMLTVVSIALIALYAHLSGRFVYIDVALVYGLLSFLAVLAIARFLERRR
ncbi:MAG: monovalent cation/H+ antiporter complex subunit F [Phyllobacterium sp.]|uniref:monovalent cation/H+ antiporter complex subunit F n=1 Tax=Phyllobacterium sp. TaxID=1871046 RepID=UPI0030F21616